MHSFGQDGGSGGGICGGIYGQLYDNSGNKYGSEFKVNTYTALEQDKPSVAALTGGGFVVTWQSEGQDGDLYGIYGQIYNGYGDEIGEEFRINSSTIGDQSTPSVSGLRGNDFVVIWQTKVQEDNDHNVYGKVFYMDTDGDDIPDSIENVSCMDMEDADTDDDGIPDGVEDLNHNGQVDFGETDPCNPDTDSDGLTDGQEDINYNGIVDSGETDPCNADTDGDGMPDSWEIFYGLNPIANDADADKDGDGYSNLHEYITGTSPDNSSDYKAPPIADAGEDQLDVIEGETVTLYGTNSSDPDDGIASYLWEQIDEGPVVTLSDETDVIPTFVTPPVGENGITLTFKLTVTDKGGLTSEDTVAVTIEDNEITGFPEYALTFTTSTNQSAGCIMEEGGNIVALDIIEPSMITDTVNRPENLVYGLMDFNVKTDVAGGTARVTIYLPLPAPAGYS
ncbi:MAG: hypothetical protein PVG39_08360, partial [Desulfobacteraceae bacterium]